MKYFVYSMCINLVIEGHALYNLYGVIIMYLL